MAKKARPMGSDEVIFSSPDYPPSKGGPFVMIGSDRVVLTAGSNTPDGARNVVAITRGSGTVVSGPLAICDNPHNVRIGIYNRLNDSLLSGIPSTIATPIPVMNFVDDSDMLKKQVDAIKGAVMGMQSLATVLMK